MKTVVIVLFTVVATINAVIVSIPELGAISGIEGKSTWTNRPFYQFLSVKFAESPSGDLRFKPPVPVKPWSGTYDATKQRIMCPQFSTIEKILNNTQNLDMEDCLTMNIFKPKISNPTNKSNLLPVMVFIHGGANIQGSSVEHPGNYFMEKDIILVVPQYRLGVLGFLSLHTDDIPGNAGLMDQLEALKWVNKYIKYFGGDSSRVTLAGQSAGAEAVEFLLASPAVGSHLFQQAIVQSSNTPSNIAVIKDPVSNAVQLYNALTNSNTQPTIDEMQNAFKNAPVISLLLATLKLIDNPLRPLLIAKPVVQKKGSLRIFEEDPIEIIRSGKHRAVPMIAGITKNDGSNIAAAIFEYSEPLNLTNNEDFLRNQLNDFMLNFSGINDATNFITYTINDKYFKDALRKSPLTFKDMARGISDIGGIVAFKSPTFQCAKLNSARAPTYLYTFDYKGRYTGFVFGKDPAKYPFDGGVTHADDLLYFFPYWYTEPLNFRDRQIAKMMVDFWTSFVITGTPKSSLSRVNWPPLQKNFNGPYIHLNRLTSIGKDFVESEFAPGL